MEFDVIVYGGDPSAVAAALASSYAHCSTALLCPGDSLAGAYGAGLRNFNEGWWDSPLFQEVSSLFMRAWGHEYYDPEELELHFQQMIRSAGVQVFTNALPLKAKSSDGLVKSTTFLCGAERIKFHAHCYIDASDEGTLASLCGALPLRGATQWLGTNARIGGLDTHIADLYDKELFLQLHDDFHREVLGGLPPEWLILPRVVPLPRGTTAILSASAVCPVESFDGNPFALRQMCRSQLDAALIFLGDRLKGWENAHIIHTGDPMRLNPVPFIGELVQRHPNGPSAMAAFQWRGVTVALSSRALTARGMDNLFLCGGCASASNEVFAALKSLTGRLCSGSCAGSLAAGVVLQENAAQEPDDDDEDI